MEIPKFSPEEPKKPQKTEELPFSQKETIVASFDAVAALRDEKTILSKLRGRAKEIAKVLILASALIAGEGIVSPARAGEKPSTPITQVEKEKHIDLGAVQFAKLESDQQFQYLQNLVEEPPEYKKVKEIMDGYEVEGKKLITESGMKRITQLKERLDTLYEKEADPKEKEKINQAFLTVHRFILEYGIDSFGQQALTVYGINSDETMAVNVSDFIMRERSGKPIFDPKETDDFLENGEQGPRLANFIQESKKVSGSELSKIKQIYDLVAYQIPRYKWYYGEGDRGKHGYQTFEQLLEKQAGICTEKNALLVYTLRQAGFDAYLLGFSGHIYTRVLTAEGTLEIDVTNSDPLTLDKLATQGEYSFEANEVLVKGMPQNLKQYAKKWDEEGRYHISIPLDSDETIKYVASEKGISTEKLREILKKIAEVKPHPLYEVGRKGIGNITPENSGQYSEDLFKKQINYE